MQKLTRLEKFGFGAGDGAVNISMMSILFLLVRLVDAVTDPLMGWITDRIHLSQGRYRPWLAMGVALMLSWLPGLIFSPLA